MEGKYDLVIVGCGFTGSVIGHLAAKEKKKVLILERRDHIAGNMYDELDEKTGILVQKYGVHSFHTDHEKVFNFLQNVGEWVPFTLQVLAEIKEELTPSPFNFSTIDQYFTPEKALEIKTNLMNTYEYSTKVTILDMLNSENQVVREYANFLFEEDYKPYSSKQWGIPPEELDISILQRVPVRLSYVNQYFDDRYQMQPKEGYSHFFQKLLDSPYITVKLNCNALEYLTLQESTGEILYQNRKTPVVYTGALDELFEKCFGELPYRSLKFDYHVKNTPNFQPVSGVVFPFAEGYTRILEFSKLMPLPPQTDKTIVAYEYPVQYGSEGGEEPYYPILTQESQELYEKYLAYSNQYGNLYPCGRLGDFKYYNMDQAILRALELYPTIQF